VIGGRRAKVGIDDVASRESAFVAAATAAVVSPRVRGVLRRGAVYGVAGALKAGDVVASAARGAAHGFKDGSADAGEATTQAEPAASPATPAAATADRPARSSRTTRAPRGPSQ
jgi:hypothetical protein